MKSFHVMLVTLLIMFASSTVFADDRPYRDGTVWEVTFVKVKDNHTEDYISNLKAGHMPILDAFIKKGWVTSYKIIGFARNSPKDWNMMLLVEYPNFATFDRAYDDWNAEVEKVFKTEKMSDDSNKEREEIRMIWGTKLGQEMVPTK